MSTLKVDTINTSDGTGNITVSRPLSGSGASLTNLPAANLTGTLPAISGASLTNLPAGGDSRNFIIDGDFTQWPEGTTFAAAVSSAYTAALWEYIAVGGGGVCTVQRSTDVPTVAQSNHQSSYSLHVDVTTADTTIAASHFYALRHIITGSDFAFLHKQEVTLQFWVKSTKIGVFTVVFGNGAQNRSLPYEYTISTTNTWEKKTITVTLDASGTWLFTEADKGLSIEFVIATGSDLEDGTHNTWGASHEYGEGDNVNGMDSTSNDFRISQVGLHLGSTAPTFLGEPIAMVKDQVAWYVQRYGGAAYHGSGQIIDTTRGAVFCEFERTLRKSPTCSFKGTNTNFNCWNNNTLDACTANPTFDGQTKEVARIILTVASGLVAGESCAMYNDTSAEYILFDARH